MSTPKTRTRKPRTPKANAKRSFVGLRLPSVDRERLEADARAEGLTLSEFVRRLAEDRRMTA